MSDVADAGLNGISEPFLKQFGAHSTGTQSKLSLQQFGNGKLVLEDIRGRGGSRRSQPLGHAGRRHGRGLKLFSLLLHVENRKPDGKGEVSGHMKAGFTTPASRKRRIPNRKRGAQEVSECGASQGKERINQTDEGEHRWCQNAVRVTLNAGRASRPQSIRLSLQKDRRLARCLRRRGAERL